MMIIIMKKSIKFLIDGIKKYGNNVNLHDEDNTDKNNLKAVARQVKQI